MFEAYDSEKHPANNAYHSVLYHGEDERFINLQQRIRDDNTDLTDEKLQAEIDEFLEIDPSHSMHFVDNKPDVNMWRAIRNQYARDDILAHDDGWDPEKPNWFHSLQISLYVRDPIHMSEAKYEELQELVKEKIPGYDFDSFHLPISHFEDLCIEGDIFEHESAKKYDQLH